jgi:hypothetical protein
MGSGVEGITQSGVSTPKALPKIPVLKIHSLPTIHCYYYLDISSNIPALSGLYVLRSRFLKALTLSIFPYHVLSTHWWICSMHTLLGDGWIAKVFLEYRPACYISTICSNIYVMKINIADLKFIK